ncbi:MAG: tail fiber domain-containing protein, partial [Sphingobacteriales bacterium]
TNERMRINSSGNVGIGATSFNGTAPEKLLVDAGTTTSYNVISGKGSINSYLQLNIQNNSSGTGASSDVVATANNGSESSNFVNMGINGGGNTSSGVLGGANTAYLYSTGNDFSIGNGTNDAELKFFTTTSSTNTERMRIEGTTGNVAIGTTSFNGTAPEKLLVDAGTTTSYNVISGKGSINSYLQLNIQNSSSGTGASSDVVATANNGSESANFVNMGINGGGNTSTGVIGGANTAYLYATGNDFAIGNATSAKDLVFFTGGTGASNERVRVTSSAIQPGSDNAISNGTSSRRWSVVYAANGTIQTSDLRLKKNIKKNILPLSYGLKEVMQMQPVSYDWKDNTGSHKIGLIAQEVKKIVPEVVVGDETKENLGMNYAELVPVLINSVKELKTEITELQKQIAELKKQTKK